MRFKPLFFKGGLYSRAPGFSRGQLSAITWNFSWMT